jgi:hypothetical protein
LGGLGRVERFPFLGSPLWEPLPTWTSCWARELELEVEPTLDFPARPDELDDEQDETETEAEELTSALFVVGEIGEFDLEAGEEGAGIFSLGLLGPRTLPSFAYSQVKLRRIQRLHDGCSPLHWNRSEIGGGGKSGGVYFCFSSATFFACLGSTETGVFWCTVEYASLCVE